MCFFHYGWKDFVINDANLKISVWESASRMMKMFCRKNKADNVRKQEKTQRNLTKM